MRVGFTAPPLGFSLGEEPDSQATDRQVKLLSI